MAEDDKTNIQKLSDQGPRQPDANGEVEEPKAAENPEVQAEPEKPEADDEIGEALLGELDAVTHDDVDEETAENVNVDDVIAEADPSFKKEMDSLGAEDFSKAEVNADAGGVATPGEEEKVPSAFKAFLSNLPKDVKIRYVAAIVILMVMVPFSAFIFMGKILPSFDLPYIVTMDEISKDVYRYPTDGVEVPLFDDFRSKSFTFALPKTMITLKKDDEGTSYGEFEFFLNLREKDLDAQIKLKQSEIIDLIQRTLEEVTWRELQSPIGKERVKKVIRHRVNEYLQGNLVLGVYYRSVILHK